MEKNEMRIGNYIKTKSEGIIPIERGWQIDEGEETEPIPLTEEWLLKFGFYFDLKTDYDGYWKKYKEGFEIRIYKFEDYFEYGWQLGHDPIKIKYVHQLQNLYFSLTGEELTIH